MEQYFEILKKNGFEDLMTLDMCFEEFESDEMMKKLTGIQLFPHRKKLFLAIKKEYGKQLKALKKGVFVTDDGDANDNANDNANAMPDAAPDIADQVEGNVMVTKLAEDI